MQYRHRQPRLLQPHVVIGHDSRIAEHCVLSTFVNIAGACCIGERTYVGMSTAIRERTTVGGEAIIGMGSVVYHDIAPGLIAMGNPARGMRKNEDKKVFG